MKKILLLALVVMGCNTMTKEEAAGITRKFLEDYAFKNKCEFKIHELNIVSLRYTDSKTLDSAEVAYIDRSVALNKRLSEIQRNVIKKHGITLSDFESFYFYERSQEELNRELNSINELESELISFRNKRIPEIKKRNFESKITYAKVFLKAEPQCFKKPQKFYDTLDIFIDKNNKVITPENMYSLILLGHTLGDAEKHVKTLPF